MKIFINSPHNFYAVSKTFIHGKIFYNPVPLTLNAVSQTIETVSPTFNAGSPTIEAVLPTFNAVVLTFEAVSLTFNAVALTFETVSPTFIAGTPTFDAVALTFMPFLAQNGNSRLFTQDFPPTLNSIYPDSIGKLQTLNNSSFYPENPIAQSKKQLLSRP